MEVQRNSQIHWNSGQNTESPSGLVLQGIEAKYLIVAVATHLRLKLEWVKWCMCLLQIIEVLLKTFLGLICSTNSFWCRHARHRWEPIVTRVPGAGGEKAADRWINTSSADKISIDRTGNWHTLKPGNHPRCLCPKQDVFNSCQILTKSKKTRHWPPQVFGWSSFCNVMLKSHLQQVTDELLGFSKRNQGALKRSHSRLYPNQLSREKPGCAQKSFSKRVYSLDGSPAPHASLGGQTLSPPLLPTCRPALTVLPNHGTTGSTTTGGAGALLHRLACSQHTLCTRFHLTWNHNQHSVHNLWITTYYTTPHNLDNPSWHWLWDSLCWGTK